MVQCVAGVLQCGTVCCRCVAVWYSVLQVCCRQKWDRHPLQHFCDKNTHVSLSVLQYSVVRYSVLQVCCRQRWSRQPLQHSYNMNTHASQRVAAWHRVLQLQLQLQLYCRKRRGRHLLLHFCDEKTHESLAACCSVLQCCTVCFRCVAGRDGIDIRCNIPVLRKQTSLSRCVAVCCSVVQCVAGVLQKETRSPFGAAFLQ